MSCESRLVVIKVIVAGATAGLITATGFVIAAAAANVSFFGAPAAPPLMIGASIAAGAALTALGTAMALLLAWSRECLAHDCQGKFEDLRNAIAGATTATSVVLYGCLALIPISWIPWAASIPMAWLLAAIAIAYAAIGIVAFYFGPLTDCGERVAKSRGPLMAGEKASDPWFLRIKPANPPNYESAIVSTPLGDLTHSQWLECHKFDVSEWEVDAVAYIIGGPTFPLTFKWTLGGNGVPSSSIQNAGTTSTLKLKSPPLPTTTTLAVTATDASGFTRTLTVDINLADYEFRCHLILHFVPPMFDLPTHGPGPIEITPEMDRFARSLMPSVETHEFDTMGRRPA